MASSCYFWRNAGDTAKPLEKSSKDLFDSPGAVMILLDGNPGAVEHADEEIGKGHATGKLMIMAMLVAKVFASRDNRWIMLAPVQRTGGAAVEDYGVVQQGTVLASALAHLVEKGAEPGQEELIPKTQLFKLVGMGKFVNISLHLPSREISHQVARFLGTDHE